MKKLMMTMILAILLTVTGCSQPPAEESVKVSFAAVIGEHECAYELPLSAETIYNALYEVCYTYGDVTFINCDGDPKVFFQASIPEPDVNGLSEAKKKSIATGYVTQLQEALKQAEAKVTEVNTLMAIQKAAQALRDAETGSEKLLLIMDSGLSTTGYLNFTTGLLDADPQVIVDALKAENAIPDLTGVKVSWAFCGEVASPQEPLNDRQKRNLKDIWEAVLLEGGAVDVDFTNDFASSTPYTDMPSVSLVEVDKAELDVIPTMTLDSTSMNFIGNSAEFVDVEAATAEADKVAAELLKNPGCRVYIVGTTATGDAQFCKKLSEDRAIAVKNLLVSKGVSESQMIPIGLGYEDYWHIPDLNENGKQIESLARQNRKVMVIDVNSEDAAKLGI